MTDMNSFSALLLSVIEQMVADRNITDYYVGGAYGFDAIASLSVLQLKEKYPEVRLHLILPCSNEEQTDGWNTKRKTEFENILGLADSVEQVSERYYNGCMKARNARLVELATDYCICYWNPKHFRSGTGQTVRMAQKKGIEVINLFEKSANSVKSPDKRLTDAANSSIMDISYHLEVSTMPRKKKTETAPVAEVTAEVVTEAVKETAQEVPAEKPAKKPAAKKAPAKKTATKTPAKAAEKNTTAKATTKTAAKTTRATAPIETVKVQFGGDEYDFAEIKKAVEADYKSKFKGKVKTIEFYIKLEDKAVYYVINGDFSDKIEL
jgi:uncharacterized phage-like protein YoqJ